MKVRVQRAGPAQGAAASLMLSPGDDGWCRIDAGRIGRGDAPAPVVLTGMSREQVGGLLDLRDGAPIDLYATPAVFEHLTQAMPLLPVLQQFCGVQWHLIPVAGEQRQADFAIERLPSLSFTALTTSEGAGERIALAVRDARSGARLLLMHGVAIEWASASALQDWMDGADCVIVDRMPHDAGTHWLDVFARTSARRKLLLDANGHSRPALRARGIDCAGVRLEFEL